MERKSKNGGFKLTNTPFKILPALAKVAIVAAKMGAEGLKAAAKSKQKSNEEKEEEKGLSGDLIKSVVGAISSGKGGMSGGK